MTTLYKSKITYMTDKYYIVSKTYHYTTDENKIVEIEAGSTLAPSSPASDKYVTTTMGKENQLIVCFLDPRLVESNPEFFTLCSGNETVLYSLLSDLEKFFDERDAEDGLAEKAYQRILKILNLKDEISSLKEENSKLASEVFILKLNSKKDFQFPLQQGPLSNPVEYTPPSLLNNVYNCSVCGVDLSKNTHYVCLSSACPGRISWSSGTGNITYSDPTFSNNLNAINTPSNFSLNDKNTSTSDSE